MGAFQINRTSPAQTTTILTAGQTLTISATASLSANFNLKANGASIDQKSNATSYSFSPTITENTNFILEATNNGQTVNTAFNAIVKPTNVEDLVPSGMKDGANINGNSVTFVLYAPGKEFVHLIGSSIKINHHRSIY